MERDRRTRMDRRLERLEQVHRSSIPRMFLSAVVQMLMIGAVIMGLVAVLSS